jgi:protein SCO1/2
VNRRITLLIGLGLLGCACVALAITMSNLRKQATPSDQPAERYAYLPAPSSENQTLPLLWDAPEFLLTDQRGRPVDNRALAGHVWIADFIFTRCTTVCPLITAKMALLQRRISSPGVRFVSFSVDPEHDTEAALAKYAKAWRPAAENRWLLLRTEDKNLGELVKGMHVALEKTNDQVNPIVHTAMFFLVDAQGSVRGVYDSGDDAKLERLVKDTHRLLGADAGAPAAKAATGEELYMTLGCGACHTRKELAPPLAGLLGKSVALQDAGTVIADSNYIRESIVAPGAKLTAGYLKLMPSYADQLSAAELDSLVEYVSALRGKAPPAKADAEPIATLAFDPVCGMEVRVTKDTPSAKHAGHVHHFCSESCRVEFSAHPEAYLDAGSP